MHMIGISGRCSAERRSSSGLYPFPFDARARRGCTFISASKTGCQWCRALVSETPVTMRWAYLILVSGLPLDRSRWAAGHLDDPCFPAADEDLRDRLRERDHVLFFQPVCRIDPRERRQVLEHVDEDVVLGA